MKERHFFALLGWLALVPAGWSAAVTRGPYLQSGSPTGLVIRWRTDVATATRVLYGPAPGNLNSEVTSLEATTEHSIRLSGLAPATTYYYAVGDATEVQAGGDAQHFFVTAPLPGAESAVRIWVIGDSGTGGDGTGRAESVRDAYRHSPLYARNDVWLMLGDNAYDIGTDADYQRAVFDTFRDLLRHTMLWPTFGNHDSYADGGVTYFNLFTLPQNGESGGLASGSEHYYSFDYANIHFVCLDSQGSLRTPDSPMLAWLEEDLAATTQKWVIAYWHHPPYTKGSHDSDLEAELVEMRNHALPILEAGGVDLVLAGHSHSYERSFLLDGHYGVSPTLLPSMIKDPGDGRETGNGVYGKEPEPHSGAVYSVCGSSGKISGGALNHPVMVASLNLLGSLILDVQGDRLEARFLDDQGAERDQFTISKAPLVTLAATVAGAAETGPVAGAVMLSRTRGLSEAFNINLSLAGTATVGSDYQAISVPISIPAGQASVSFSITPIADNIAEGAETVFVRAEPGSGYRTHGSSRRAEVTIADKPGDDWRFSKFGLLANIFVVSGDAADPDSDGLNNLLERAFGLDPLLASPPMLSAEAAGEYLAISFPRSAAASDLTFRVQVSGDLVTWNDGSTYTPAGSTPANAFTTQLGVSPGDPQWITVRDNVPAAGGVRRFIRLQVVAP